MERMLLLLLELVSSNMSSTSRLISVTCCTHFLMTSPAPFMIPGSLSSVLTDGKGSMILSLLPHGILRSIPCFLESKAISLCRGECSAISGVVPPADWLYADRCWRSYIATRKQTLMEVVHQEDAEFEARWFGEGHALVMFLLVDQLGRFCYSKRTTRTQSCLEDRKEVNGACGHEKRT